jgi:hypothetical protein
MNVSTAMAQLHSALKDLRMLWQETKSDWKDPVQRDFEINHWEPLESQVMAALREMDRLSVTLYRIEQDTS